MDPKTVQSRAPEAPKTLLEPGCRWKLFPEPFWPLFLTPPGTSKIVLSLWRGANFRKNCVWRPGAQNRPQNEPKIEPKSTPRGFHKA